MNPDLLHILLQVQVMQGMFNALCIYVSNMYALSSPQSLPPLFSTLRELEPHEWKFGYNKVGEAETRLIVFEKDNNKYCREYCNKSTRRCLGCHNLRKYINAAWSEDKTKLFVPYNHACQPRLYSEVEKEQHSIYTSMVNKRNNFEDFGSKRARIEYSSRYKLFLLS